MFIENYLEGKQSEEESLEQLSKLFNCDLKQQEDIFSHFDFYSDNIFVELKTRKDIKYIDGKFYFKEKELDSLIFDAVKMRSAYQYNKKNKSNKHFYIVWKIYGDRYFSWKINWQKGDYYLKCITDKFGHETNRTRDIIYVHTRAIKELI
jgi:hypothetical protein